MVRNRPALQGWPVPDHYCDTRRRRAGHSMAFTKTPDCEICNAAPSVVRSIITNPLITSVSTRVCLDCYRINAEATAQLLALDPRLVVTEVAA